MFLISTKLRGGGGGRGKNHMNTILFSNLLFQKFSVLGLGRSGLTHQMRHILNTCFGYFLIMLEKDHMS